MSNPQWCPFMRECSSLSYTGGDGSRKNDAATGAMCAGQHVTSETYMGVEHINDTRMCIRSPKTGVHTFAMNFADAVALRHTTDKILAVSVIDLRVQHRPDDCDSCKGAIALSGREYGGDCGGYSETE